MSRRRLLVLGLSVLMCCALLGSGVADACTDVVVGKDASVSGATITSHTADEGGFGGMSLGLGSGVGYDSRIRTIPGQQWPEGTVVPIYRQFCEAGPNTKFVKVGEVPQAPRTYTYFHVGYPFLNEYGLAIGETTICQREELLPSERAIMTVEQLEVFALQRCTNARAAIKLIGELAEKYGFQSSCGTMGECMSLADGEEAWILEVYGVGPLWSPESGKPGAVWAARRVPDDEVCVEPNVSRIGVLDFKSNDFIISDHVMEPAIENGWYDPASGEPFDLTKAYTPEKGDWSAASDWTRNRLWFIYRSLCPSKEWPYDAPLSAYPFSVKPERKVSVQDVIAFQRSTFEGTDHSLADLPEWYVDDGNGGKVKSPLATPYISNDLAALLGVYNERPIARYMCSYGFVAEVRNWLPAPVKTCLWYYNDNPGTSMYVPVYCGATDTPLSWRTNDRYAYSRDSAWWAFASVDQFANFRFQEAIKDIGAVRDPLEAQFFAMQPAVEKAAAELWAIDAGLCRQFVTDYTANCMKKAEAAYWSLADQLLTKYNNNQF